MKVIVSYSYEYLPSKTTGGGNFGVSVEMLLPAQSAPGDYMLLHPDLQSSDEDVFGCPLRPLAGVLKTVGDMRYRGISAQFFGDSWANTNAAAEAAVESAIAKIKAVVDKNTSARLSQPANRSETFVIL